MVSTQAQKTVEEKEWQVVFDWADGAVLPNGDCILLPFNKLNMT